MNPITDREYVTHLAVRTAEHTGILPLTNKRAQ